MRPPRRHVRGVLALVAMLAPAAALAQAPEATRPDLPRPKVVEAPRAFERWAPPPACIRDKISPRDYFRCLYDNARAAEQALEAAFSEAMTVIDARADLVPVQRVRWKNLLDEAQSRFLLFRNFDCQSVAPFEGRRGIGNFEQRSLCLIDSNLARAAELKARYPAPAPGTTPAQPSGPLFRPGVWIFWTPPAAD